MTTEPTQVDPGTGTATDASDRVLDESAVPAPKPAPPRSISITAITFGAIFTGLGLAGVIAGTSQSGWGTAMAFGLIAMGLIETGALWYRWTIVSNND